MRTAVRRNDGTVNDRRRPRVPAKPKASPQLTGPVQLDDETRNALILFNARSVAQDELEKRSDGSTRPPKPKTRPPPRFASSRTTPRPLPSKERGPGRLPRVARHLEPGQGGRADRRGRRRDQGRGGNRRGRRSTRTRGRVPRGRVPRRRTRGRGGRRGTRGGGRSRVPESPESPDAEPEVAEVDAEPEAAEVEAESPETEAVETPKPEATAEEPEAGDES